MASSARLLHSPQDAGDAACRRRSAGSRPSSGFTLIEVLVVLAVIALLVALLLPALSAARRSGQLAASQSNLRQVATYMGAYQADNNEAIVPSQFNYTYPDCPACYRGKVRSVLGAESFGEVHRGTWADILWTEAGLEPPQLDGTSGEDQYRFQAPDRAFYETVGQWGANPFRSVVENTRQHPSAANDSPPLPYDAAGFGAADIGAPGYFAANNFFNADDTVPDFDGFPEGFRSGIASAAQIWMPAQSMYLVDSWAGLVIDPEPVPYDNTMPISPTGGLTRCQVDFRYSGSCLMLFLDGSSRPVTSWADLQALESPSSGYRVRVRDLTTRPALMPSS